MLRDRSAFQFTAGALVHTASGNQGAFEMAIAAAAHSMLTELAFANTAPDDQAGPSESKIAKVVHRLLMDHSIDRTFHLQDDLREVGLTSLDMASLVLSVEAEFDLMIPERDITPANFRSVSSITSLVTRLRSSKLQAVPA
jgi:acyl carrier protein